MVYLLGQEIPEIIIGLEEYPAQEEIHLGQVDIFYTFSVHCDCKNTKIFLIFVL